MNSSKKRNSQIILYTTIFSLILSRILFYVIWKNEEIQVSFFESIFHWDCGWYQGVINGYDLHPSGHSSGADAANWAFFPLMPLIVKCVSAIASIPPIITGPIVNTIFFGLALIIAGKYILENNGTINQAVYFIVLSTFGVNSFYFSILYTEALYFLTIMAFFYFLKRKQYIAMGIVGALASATRNTGVMLVVAVIVSYTYDYYLYHKEFKLFEYISSVLKNYKLLLGGMLIPLGLFVHMLYLYILMGDALAFMHIQRAWGGAIHSQFPLKTLWGGTTNIASEQFYWALFGWLWIYAMWKMLKRRQFPELIQSLIFFSIPLTLRLDSIPRFFVGSALPMLGLINDFEQWSKVKKGVILIASIIWEMFLIKSWMIGEHFLV